MMSHVIRLGPVLAAVALFSCAKPAPVPAAERAPVSGPADASVPEVLDAGAGAQACLDPWTGGTRDARWEPLPLDPQEVAAVEHATKEPTERAYSLGRIHYEAHHWAEAATAFRRIAFEHPEHELGLYAAVLYLECVDTLAARGGRGPICRETLVRDVPRLHDLYCTNPRKPHVDECRNIDAKSSP